MNPDTSTKTEVSKYNSLYKISGIAALILSALLLIAIISLITGWLSILQNNWLVILFKLNVGSYGMQFDQLLILNPLDLVIMTFVGVICLGLYFILRRTNKILSLIALIQIFLGILLFIVTKAIGRSAVMGTILLISFVILRNKVFHKVIAIIGILASLLLLVGDFGTSGNYHSSILATLISIGYVLLIVWLFLMANTLFQLSKKVNG